MKRSCLRLCLFAHIRFMCQRDCDTAVMSHPASSRQKNLENENTGRHQAILSFTVLSSLQNVKSSQSRKSTLVSYNLWLCSETSIVSAPCSFEGHQNGPAGGTRFRRRESLFSSGRFPLDSLHEIACIEGQCVQVFSLIMLQP